MSAKATPFFATARDLAFVVKEVSLQRPLSFMVAGLFKEEPTTIAHDLNCSVPMTAYLVFDRAENVMARRVPQEHGSVMYAIDQMENLHTISLQYGGLVKGPRLVASQVGTISKSRVSKQVYYLFTSVIRSQFDKIQSYYVGPEAILLLDKGIRLTPTIESPPPYDLVRPRG